jgi:hypothetical protein
MLTFLESGTEQAADLGYGDESYFGALARRLDTVAKLWPEHSPQARADAAKRLDWIRKRAQGIGWGYGDYVSFSIARRNVSLERRELTIEATKSKTRIMRIVPISTRLLSTLEMRRLDPSGYELGHDAYCSGTKSETR